VKTGLGPRQSSGLAAVSPPYARINGIRFSGSRALQHHLSVVRLPGDKVMIGESAHPVYAERRRTNVQTNNNITLTPIAV
jgi:hypothetical protein